VAAARCTGRRSLIHDLTLTGSGRVVAIDLRPELGSGMKGAIVDVVAVYESSAATMGGAPDFARYRDLSVPAVGDVCTRNGATWNDFGQWSRYTPGIRAILTLDFATLPSGPPLAFTASETCRKCPADFTISGCIQGM
jgi:hypothetical protein